MSIGLSGPMLPPKSGASPKQLMVLLHGYGSDGNDLISLGFQWRDTFPDMMFVSPNAPHICANNPAGFEWFPLPQDPVAGRALRLPDARPYIVNFLIDLWGQTGLTAKDTVLAGFSQGSMMALYVGTSLDQQLAGIVAFSGAFYPAPGVLEGKFAKPPICLIHGDMDEVLEPALSENAAAELTKAGFDVTLHISRGVGHGIAEDGLAVASSFLQAQLSAA